MKLYVASASPFGRKCAILVHELGLEGRVDFEPAAVSPINRNEEIARGNPLVKIPTLILDDGSALFDSPVICEYLDSFSGAPRFFPAPGPARWVALKRQALADGLMDAAILLRYEQALRPEPLRWPDWVTAQQSKLIGALDAMEADAPSFGAGFDIGHVATACAVGYLDLRFPQVAWREGRARLAAWFAGVSQRQSLIATFPKA
jgi:glutathione S-transferase